ncbi:hypothetical protein CH372_19250 [Leptospira meyeri]|uniref:SMI1/KNR4 family protein n=1 Tax=Leptospira meyeri TaxID=29508 RepID=UPI000C2A6563|nr:SMI1/KNR4 family protein [Leptospira meyeri]PKA10471.1 hypothetical protein CH372_19250 [Leptospira meyeri]
MIKIRDINNFLHKYRNTDKRVIQLSKSEFIILSRYVNDLNEFDFIKTDDDFKFPKDIIPIAVDQGGNLICVSLGESLMSGIYFWDHEEYDDLENAFEFIVENFQLLGKMITDEKNQDLVKFLNS